MVTRSTGYQNRLSVRSWAQGSGFSAPTAGGAVGGRRVVPATVAELLAYDAKVVDGGLIHDLVPNFHGGSDEDDGIATGGAERRRLGRFWVRGEGSGSHVPTVLLAELLRHPYPLDDVLLLAGWCRERGLNPHALAGGRF